MSIEKWDRVSVDKIEEGDHIKSVVTFLGGGSTWTSEGDVAAVRKKDGSTYAELRGVPYSPWTDEEVAAIDFIDLYRRRPVIELPTTNGSAVLVKWSEGEEHVAVRIGPNSWQVALKGTYTTASVEEYVIRVLHAG